MKNCIDSKKNELKNWISKIGMTQKYFAEIYCQEEYVEPSEEYIEQFYEKFKKQIGKNSKDISIIEKYFDFLFELEEFKKAGYVKPKFYFEDSFNDSFNKKMGKISEMISEKLIENKK